MTHVSDNNISSWDTIAALGRSAVIDLRIRHNPVVAAERALHGRQLLLCHLPSMSCASACSFRRSW